MRKCGRSNLVRRVCICFLLSLFLPFFCVASDLDFSGNDRIDLTDAIMVLQALTEKRNDLRNDAGLEHVVSIINILLPNSLPDSYESDDTPEEAKSAIINTTYPNHNFHYPGDEDWFRFSGEPGRTYTIEVKNPGPRSDVTIELYDTDGTTKIVSDHCHADNGEKSLIWNDCQQEGNYYIRTMNSDPAILGSSTRYDLHLSVSDPIPSFFIFLDDEQSNDFAVADDEDWVVFYGMEGMPYEIEAINVGSKCSPKITLYDTDGKTKIRSSDYIGPGSDVEMVWRECKKDGFYYLKVTNGDSDIGEDTGYDLHVFIPDAAFPRGAVVGYVGSDPDQSVGAVDEVDIRIRYGSEEDSQHVYYNPFIGVFYTYGHREGTYTLSANAEGYEDFSVEMEIGAKTIRQDIWMIPSEEEGEDSEGTN